MIIIHNINIKTTNILNYLKKQTNRKEVETFTVVRQKTHTIKKIKNCTKSIILKCEMYVCLCVSIAVLHHHWG